MEFAEMLRAAAAIVDEGGLPSNGAILVWPADSRFVPKAIWDICDHDDIDWVAFVPDKYRDAYIGWLQSRQFGCCSVDEHDYPGGRVYEGHHA